MVLRLIEDMRGYYQVVLSCIYYQDIKLSRYQDILSLICYRGYRGYAIDDLLSRVAPRIEGVEDKTSRISRKIFRAGLEDMALEGSEEEMVVKNAHFSLVHEDIYLPVIARVFL